MKLCYRKTLIKISYVNGGLHKRPVIHPLHRNKPNFGCANTSIAISVLSK